MVSWDRFDVLSYATRAVLVVLDLSQASDGSLVWPSWLLSRLEQSPCIRPIYKLQLREVNEQLLPHDIIFCAELRLRCIV